MFKFNLIFIFSDEFKLAVTVFDSSVSLPCGILFVLLWNEEPNKLSIAHSSFSLHWVSPRRNKTCIISHMWLYHKYTTQNLLSSSYLVTAPENSLSMILLDEAFQRRTQSRYTLKAISQNHKSDGKLNETHLKYCSNMSSCKAWFTQKLVNADRTFWVNYTLKSDKN